MKRITVLAIICLSLCQLIAQNLPQGIAYQAVAVKDGPYSIAGQNPQAIYWSNKDINVRFTIYEKYPGGSNQYSETHATKTDDYGVFNLIIGQGNVISGDFTKIPWDIGTAHLQVEIDFDNNGTYKLTSLERFWSVPYAFVTRKSSSTSTDSALNALNNKFNYLKNRDKDTVIGNEGGVSYKSLDSLNKVLVAKLAAIKTSDKDTVIGNEWQKLTRNNDTLVLSDGGGKVTLGDEDPKNELQVLSRIKDTVSLSINGGRFVLNDEDPKNELQELFVNNDSLKLTKSKSGIPLERLINNNSNLGGNILKLCQQNVWKFGGGRYDNSLKSPQFIYQKNQIVRYKDTIFYGNYSYNYKSGNKVPTKILINNYGLEEFHYLFQDSQIIIVGSPNFNLHKTTIKIISWPSRKVVFDMDKTYPGHALTSIFSQGFNPSAIFYYRDTLSILFEDRNVVFLPKQNKLLIDKKIQLKSGWTLINSQYFQIKNAKYFLRTDTLYKIDFLGNVTFEDDLFYSTLNDGQSPYNPNINDVHSRTCLPLNDSVVFLCDQFGRGMFYNIHTKDIAFFNPSHTSLTSPYFFYDGISIYHVPQSQLGTSGGNDIGFFCDKIKLN